MTDTDSTRPDADGDATSDSENPSAEAAPAADSTAPSNAPAASDAGDSGDALSEERDRLKAQLMRTAADFENFRRRSKREIDEARMRGKDEAVIELLPVMDNLERAVTAGESAEEVESVLSGVKMVLKLFEDTATRMGLNRVQSVGARFDPAMHDAIQHQETDEFPPGSITAEVASGYMFGKRLIRPAMVVVARAPQKPKEEADESAAATASEAPPAEAAQEAASKSAPPAGDTSDEGTNE